MTTKVANRKRSITINSLEPAFQKEREKNRLKTSSINSIASGIAFFFNGSSRPRSSTWHGDEDVETATSINSSKLTKSTLENSLNFSSNNNSIADLKDFDNEFESHEILRQIVSEELEKQLEGKSYVNEESVKLAAVITQAVENRVREITKTSTKVVAVVYIGEIRDQGIEITSQCLWDPDSDSFATASFRNNSLFAVCTVFTVS